MLDPVGKVLENPPGAVVKGYAFGGIEKRYHHSLESLAFSLASLVSTVKLEAGSSLSRTCSLTLERITSSWLSKYADSSFLPKSRYILELNGKFSRKTRTKNTDIIFSSRGRSVSAEIKVDNSSEHYSSSERKADEQLNEMNQVIRSVFSAKSNFLKAAPNHFPTKVKLLITAGETDGFTLQGDTAKEMFDSLMDKIARRDRKLRHAVRVQITPKQLEIILEDLTKVPTGDKPVTTNDLPLLENYCGHLDLDIPDTEVIKSLNYESFLN